MAKITAKNIVVAEEVKVIKPKRVKEFTLVLSEEEAVVLENILGKIGGCCGEVGVHDIFSPRYYASEIYDALKTAGVPHVPMKTQQGTHAFLLNSIFYEETDHSMFKQKVHDAIETGSVP